MIHRHFFSIFILIFFHSTLSSQDLRLGIYSPVYSDPSYSYELLEDNTFKYTHYGHLKEITRGRGKYALIGDSIHFHFEPYSLEEKFKSKYDLKLDPKAFDGYLQVILTAFDIRDSIPMNHVWIGLSDEETMPSEYFFTNEKGELNFLVNKPMDKGFLRIRDMGYQELKIRIDTIKSVSAEIKAYLNPSGEYRIGDLRQSFQVSQVSDTSFILTNTEGNSTKFIKRINN